MTERIDTDAQGNVIGVTYLQEETGRSRAIPYGQKRLSSRRAARKRRAFCSTPAPTCIRMGWATRMTSWGAICRGTIIPARTPSWKKRCTTASGRAWASPSCQFSHGNPGIVGGGMIADDFIKLPIIHWYRSMPPDMRRWGAENKQWMRDNFRRTQQIFGPIQDIPSPDSPRVRRARTCRTSTAFPSRNSPARRTRRHYARRSS